VAGLAETGATGAGVFFVTAIVLLGIL